MNMDDNVIDKLILNFSPTGDVCKSGNSCIIKCPAWVEMRYRLAENKSSKSNRKYARKKPKHVIDYLQEQPSTAEADIYLPMNDANFPDSMFPTLEELIGVPPEPPPEPQGVLDKLIMEIIQLNNQQDFTHHITP